MAQAPVNPLTAALRRIAADLRAENRGWALVGGLAIGARSEPRTTRDVDAAVAVQGDGEAEALVFRLQSLGYSTLTVIEQESARRLSALRLLPPGGGGAGVLVDLLFASSGIARGSGRRRRDRDRPGLVVPVARSGHLLALKVLAPDDRQRPQDLDDIRALLATARPADIEEARIAVRLIESRGFARGRRPTREPGSGAGCVAK